jgi:hypothetical protein
MCELLGKQRRAASEVKGDCWEGLRRVAWLSFGRSLYTHSGSSSRLMLAHYSARANSY